MRHATHRPIESTLDLPLRPRIGASLLLEVKVDQPAFSIRALHVDSGNEVALDPKLAGTETVPISRADGALVSVVPGLRIDVPFLDRADDAARVDRDKAVRCELS